MLRHQAQGLLLRCLPTLSTQVLESALNGLGGSVLGQSCVGSGQGYATEGGRDSGASTSSSATTQRRERRGRRQEYSEAPSDRQQQRRGGRGGDAAGPSEGREDYVPRQLARADSAYSYGRDTVSSAMAEDLALKNAPKQVFELIGDPRTGVADDVSTNPFGEITVDMVWHQLSNEVYWYKYEYAGNTLQETHRDARLSDYTRNLIYLLRASDPKQWTVDALAEKFRIRKQRVLAILALKEIEAQQIESGQLLQGPLAAYGLPVYLDDVRLVDPETDQPLTDHDRSASHSEASTSASSSSSSAPSAAASTRTSTGTYTTRKALHRAASTAEAAQLQLLNLLQAYDYDLTALRDALLQDLQRAKQLAVSLPWAPAAPASASGDSSGAEGSSGEVPAPDGTSSSADGASSSSAEDPLGLGLAVFERGVTRVLSALEPFLSASSGPLAQQRQAAQAARAATRLVNALTGANLLDQVLKVPLGAASLDFLAASARQGSASVSDAAGGVEQALLAMDRDMLERTVYSFGAKERLVVIKMLPEVRRLLNEAGVDLTRTCMDPAYHGPRHAAAAAARTSATTSSSSSSPSQQQQQQQQPGMGGMGADGGVSASVADEGGLPAGSAGLTLPLDVFGFRDFTPAQHEELISALESLQEAQAALAQRVAALGLIDDEATQDASASSAQSSSSSSSKSSPSAQQQQGSQQQQKQQGQEAVVLSAEDLRELRKAAVAYRGAEALVSEALGTTKELPGGGDYDAKDAYRKVLQELDPQALTKLQSYEALLRLKQAGDKDTAHKLARTLAAASLLATPQQQQALMAAAADAEAEAAGDAGAGAAGPSGRWAALERTNWDLLAAYVDARVQGRVFARGSGERHVVRLPTYPAFEGYSLSEFDSAQEGEVSAANRAAAEADDAEMYQRFRQDLMYNLGAVGERLWDPSHKPRPTNLRSTLDRRMVVYDIAPDGSTRHPPLYVVERDGSQRPLNEQEKVYQERRKPRSRLPYYMTRIKRVDELE